MRVLVLILLLLFPAAAKAAEYPASSIGYVYERCKADLKGSKTVEEFHKTYCSHFLSGAFLSMYWLGLSQMTLLQMNDPCNAELNKFIGNIKDKTCAPVLEHLRSLQDPLSLTFVCPEVYLDFAQNKNEREKTLALPITSFWTEFYKVKNQFCSAYKKDQIENALKEISSKYNYLDSNKPFSTDIPYKALYQQCADDIKKSDSDENVFKTTLCGAQIEGFMFNAFASVKYEVDKNAVSQNCRKSLEQIFMFRSDVPTEYCILKDESRIHIAQTFLKYMDANCKQYEEEGRSCDSMKFELQGMVAPYVFEDKRWTCAAEQKGIIK